MTRRARVGLCAAAVLLGVGCNDDRATRATSGERAVTRTETPGTSLALTGAGATFPYPLYARWFNEYGPTARISINYLSVGSAAGIAAVIDRTVDFGATDVPMSADELAEARTRVLHVPTAVGAVAVTYNLPKMSRPLRVSGEVLADLFLGRLDRWNDARLQSLNPEVALPDLPVRVVHRSDGSGTTYIFSEYLSAVSRAWASGPGRGRQVQWPVGAEGAGNEGVAAEVKATEGALGYVEVVYARQNRLPVAHIQNRSGRFVSPLPFEIASAAASVFETAAPGNRSPDDAFRYSLVDAPGRDAYPVASFTWLLVAPQVIGREKSLALTAFLRWAFDDGTGVASSLGYVPLPAHVADRVLRTMEQAIPTR
jgi:phosphate transport system substrate-binding protein